MASLRRGSSRERDTIWPRSFSTATAPGCSLGPLKTACRSSCSMVVGIQGNLVHGADLTQGAGGAIPMTAGAI